MSKIVITNATESYGRLVVHHLLQKVPANKLVVILCENENGEWFINQGINVQYTNYDQKHLLIKAFHNASKLLLIAKSSGDPLNRIKQHIQVIEAAREAQVNHLIYTSRASIDRGGFPMVSDIHLSTEFALRASGLVTTILRNALPHEFFLNEQLRKAVDKGIIITSTNNGRINTVAESDLALAAANVLIEEGHEDEVYQLETAYTWNFDELAAIISDITGKKVIHQTVSGFQALEKLINAKVEKETAYYIIALYNSMASGNEEHASCLLEKIIGKKPISIRESIDQLFN